MSMNLLFPDIPENVTREQTSKMPIMARGYKTFFMLNSADYEIINAHRYEKSRNSVFFRAQISLEYYFSCS